VFVEGSHIEEKSAGVAKSCEVNLSFEAEVTPIHVISWPDRSVP